MLSCILFEPIFLLLLVSHLRMMKKKSLKEKMLDFKHIHLRFAANDFGRSVILILSDPIFRKSIVKDTYFRQTKPQFSRVLFPDNKLVNQLQICLFVMMRMITFRLMIVIPFNNYAVILVETDSFANGASTSFVIELMVLRFVSELRSRHIIFIVRAKFNNKLMDAKE